MNLQQSQPPKPFPCCFGGVGHVVLRSSQCPGATYTRRLRAHDDCSDYVARWPEDPDSLGPLGGTYEIVYNEAQEREPRGKRDLLFHWVFIHCEKQNRRGRELMVAMEQSEWTR